MNAQIEYEGEKYRLTSMNVITKTCKLENKENAIFITIDDLLNKGVFKTAEKKTDKNEKTKELPQR